ncbi:MAG TPA: hypothetical protein VEA80_11075 [Vitreimonas sp.]|uniref:hypothetical protein n=1 Tax=Vitreimonas sp. TaxID=3069702 RepID=UPI002D68290A|nr:hypothetical protein [Vitreimonas sp.]HYD88009.1 hypothetical protein [Vitreimonas sp.]
MKVEIITRRDDLLIRRLILEPGEALGWHTDLCESFAVVVRGEQLTIEYGDGESMAVPVHAGMSGWGEPEPRPHRAVNSGASAYEEVVTFYLRAPNMDPQPRA